MKVVLVYSYKSYSFVTFIIRYAKCFKNARIMGVEEGIMCNKEMPSFESLFFWYVTKIKFPWICEQ